MSALDLRTVVLVTGALGGLLSLVMAALERRYPAAVHGLSSWTWAPLVFFSSTLLLGLRDHLPPLLGACIGNGLLVAGELLMIHGTHRFFRQPTRVPASAAILVGVVLALVPLHGEAAFRPRLALMGLVMGALFAWHAALIWRHGRQGIAARFVLAVLVAMVSVVWMRSAAALAGHVSPDLFAPSLLQAAYIASYGFGLLAVTVGTLLMASERLYAELEHLIRHDALTGVLTRRALYLEADRAMAHSRRSGEALALLILDIDHFKHINDEHGHLVGDRVLAAFAARLRSVLGEGPVLARLGGEEFVVLLRGADAMAAYAIAEHIRQDRGGDATLPAVSVSIGVSGYRSDRADTLEAWMQRADAALYQAKNAGRNQVRAAA